MMEGGGIKPPSAPPSTRALYRMMLNIARLIKMKTWKVHDKCIKFTIKPSLVPEFEHETVV